MNIYLLGRFLFVCLFSGLNSIDEISKQNWKRKMGTTIVVVMDFVVFKGPGFLGTLLSAKQINVL